MTISSRTIPTAPTGLYADDITETSCVLHWEVPKDYVDGSRYLVYLNETGSEIPRAPILLRENAEPTLAYSPLQSGTTYTVYVRQINISGEKSLPSDAIDVTTLAL